MSHALKGALLSGLVLPGLGQVVLKRYLRGAAIMAVVVGGLSVIVMRVVEPALVIVEKITSGGGVVSLSAVTDAANQAATSGDSNLNSLLCLMLICWIFAVVDAYFIGKKKDIAED